MSTVENRCSQCDALLTPDELRRASNGWSCGVCGATSAPSIVSLDMSPPAGFTVDETPAPAVETPPTMAGPFRDVPTLLRRRRPTLTIRWGGDTETAPALTVISVGTSRHIIDAGRPSVELRADHEGLHFRSPWPSHGIRLPRFLPDPDLRELLVRALGERFVVVALDTTGTEHDVAVFDDRRAAQWLARRLRAHLGLTSLDPR